MQDCCLLIGQFFPRLDHIFSCHKDYLKTCKHIPDSLPNPYNCHLCDKTFAEKDQLTRHQKKIHSIPRKNKKVQCGFCYEMSKSIGVPESCLQNFSQNTLQAHFAKYHEIRWIALECPGGYLLGGKGKGTVCQELIESKTSLIDHLKRKRVHNKSKEEAQKLAQEAEEKIFPKMLGDKFTVVSHCGLFCICDDYRKGGSFKGFTHPDYLRRHRVNCKVCLQTMSLKKLKEYPCDNDGCKYRGTTSKDLLDHKKGCDGMKKTCEICLKTVGLKNFRTHMATHKEAKHECPECGECFTVKEYLTRHLKKHSDARPCICGILFDPKTKQETEDVEKGVICQASFKTPQDVYCHRNLVHRKKHLPCKESGCSHKAATTSKLNSHWRCVHGPKKYVCDVCGKGFRESVKLKHHKVWHEDPTYPCPHCSRAFHFKKGLEAHVSFAHGDGSKNKCDHCGRRFSCASTLCIHQKSFPDGICSDPDLPGNSLGEKAILKLLLYLDVKYIKEKPVARSTVEGNPDQLGFYRYDFCVLFDQMTLWIEYDGVFHFKPHPQHQEEERHLLFIDRVQRDIHKSRYIHAQKNNLLFRLTGGNPMQQLLAYLKALDQQIDDDLSWTCASDSDYCLTLSDALEDLPPSLQTVKPLASWSRVSPLLHLSPADRPYLLDMVFLDAKENPVFELDEAGCEEALIHLAQRILYPLPKAVLATTDLTRYKDAIVFLFLRRFGQDWSMASPDAQEMCKALWYTLPEAKEIKPFVPSKTYLKKRLREPKEVGDTNIKVGLKLAKI